MVILLYEFRQSIGAVIAITIFQTVHVMARNLKVTSSYQVPVLLHWIADQQFVCDQLT